jgi:hypothetical protein
MPTNAAPTLHRRAIHTTAPRRRTGFPAALPSASIVAQILIPRNLPGELERNRLSPNQHARQPCLRPASPRYRGAQRQRGPHRRATRPTTVPACAPSNAIERTGAVGTRLAKCQPASSNVIAAPTNGWQNPSYPTLIVVHRQLPSSIAPAMKKRTSDRGPWAARESASFVGHCRCIVAVHRAALHSIAQHCRSSRVGATMQRRHAATMKRPAAGRQRPAGRSLSLVIPCRAVRGVVQCNEPRHGRNWEPFPDRRCGAGTSEIRFQMGAVADIQFLDHSIHVSFFLARAISATLPRGKPRPKKPAHRAQHEYEQSSCQSPNVLRWATTRSHHVTVTR